MIHHERPASPLAIALFGPFDVRLHGHPLPRPRTQKTHWLLALLTLQEGRALERDWLAGTLWPDSTEEQAARNLRTSLWDLRQALGPEARRLQAPTTGTLRLDLIDAEADLLIFDEAIARGDAPSLEQAVALHRGPLLQGCDEEWVFQDREAREQAYLAALETLASDALTRGEPTAAVRHLRQLLAVDPLRESVQRTLMQALAAAGEYAAVTQTYRDLRVLLHRELNTAPSPETMALYQQLRTQAVTGHESRVMSRDPSDTPAGPRPATRDSRPVTNLPRPVSSFVGRVREVREIAASLGVGQAVSLPGSEKRQANSLPHSRLVTLTGPGGVGKTRLAIQVGHAVGAEYAEGVWFVELSPLSDAALVPHAVARALGATEQPGHPLIETLREFFRPRELLLVLDNCEHLSDGCASLVEALLHGCPDLTVLATSRQPLGISGETVWRVPALSLPEPGVQVFRCSGVQEGPDPIPQHSYGPTPEHPNTRTPEHPLLQSEAVHLFVERGTAAVRSFALTAENADAVLQLCRRLDGIPLALELAAARLRALNLEQILERLEDRFRLLTGGGRTASPRQQTLRATLDWSYALLDAPERSLLHRLSVFAGGWTLDAAEAVCGEGCRVQGVGGRTDEAATLHPTPDTLHPDAVLDLLTSLVEKSLVSYEEQAGEGRYGLLETVREYAHDRLREAREEAAVRGRHLSYFLRLVQEAEPNLFGGEQGVWLDRLEREHDNLHTAIEWSLEAEEGWQEGLLLMRDLFTYWDLRNRFGGAMEYLERFVARSADWPVKERAKLLRLTGFVAMKQADYRAARRYFEECRTLRRQQGETDEDPHDLQCYGALALHEGDYAQAAALLQQGLRIYREYQEAGTAFKSNVLGWTLDILGLVAYQQGEFPSARSYYEQSIVLFREADEKTGIASALLGLGRVAVRQGETSRARALLQESLSLFRDAKEKHSVVWALNSLAWIDWHEGEDAAARAHLVEALGLCRETGRYWETIDTLISAGYLAQRQDQPARAVRLFGAAEGLRAATGEAMPPVERAEYEGSITAARAALGVEAFATAWAEGRQMTLEQAVRVAMEECEIRTATSAATR